MVHCMQYDRDAQASQGKRVIRMSINPQTAIGHVHLKVADMGRSLKFYTHVLGFQLLQQQGNLASLSADGKTTLLQLTELPGARPQPRRSTGLYHFAILVPSRADLARSLVRLAETRYPLGGASDHLVSEALYLSDPDNNGIEIYRDRPRSEWQWQQGQVEMAVDPFDQRGVLAEISENPHAWEGLKPQTRIGHIHLQVADLRQAEAFYHGVLGFDITSQMPSALFLSAGGYHHHIGLNTWHSLNAPRAPEDAAGLRSFTITLPDEPARSEVVARLQAADVPFEQQGKDTVLSDPWGIGIVLTVSN